MKKSLLLLFCLVLMAGLFGCAPKYEAPTVTFTAAGVTGYEWACTMADEAVAVCQSTTEVTDDAVGAPLNYVFTFSAAASGETTATFTFGRSWENSYVKCTCPVTVDEELHASVGELSEKVLVIDMESPDYEAICFDSDVLTVTQEADTGIFTLTPVAPGTTRVDFFYLPADDADNATETDAEEFTDRAYEITVDEEGMLFWMEAEPDESGTVDMGLTDYTSAEELASATGLFVPECKEMASCQYTALASGVAVVHFKWDDAAILYAAGNSSLDGLTDDTTAEKTVADTTVYVTSGKDTDAARADITAAWEYDGDYCYIASEDAGFTEELLETVVAAVIEAQQAE